MRADFTAILEPTAEGRVIARCAEVPGTETEADTAQEALENLASAITIVFEVNREEAERESSSRSKQCFITVDIRESKLLSASTA